MLLHVAVKCPLLPEGAFSVSLAHALDVLDVTHCMHGRAAADMIDRLLSGVCIHCTLDLDVAVDAEP